jgi:hypothetical protein
VTALNARTIHAGRDGHRLLKIRAGREGTSGINDKGVEVVCLTQNDLMPMT